MLEAQSIAPEIAPNAVIGNETTVSRLAAAFAASEPPQVDNSAEPKAEEPKVEEPKDDTKVEEKTDDPQKGVKVDEADESKDEESEDKADFKTVSKTREYLTEPEAVKAKFPRNSSNELVAEFVEISKAAKAGDDLRTQLGGEHFIAPLEKISQGIQTGDFQNVFSGIIDAGSEEALLHVISDAVHLGFVKGPEWKDEPGAADFGNAMEAIVDESLKQRFGPTATADRLGKLTEIDSIIGLVEKVDKWRGMEEVPYEEFEDIMTALNDPKYAALVKEKTELQQKLELQTKQEKTASTVQDSKAESALSTDIEGSIGKVLSETVWKTSVLRDIATDTPEMKAEKEFLRDTLQMRAVTAFNASKQKAKLLEGYKQGRQNTATFKKELADAIDTAILETQESTSKAERMLARGYGQQRNTKLVPKTPVTETKLPPTVPTERPQADNNTRKSTIGRFNDYFSQ